MSDDPAEKIDGPATPDLSVVVNNDVDETAVLKARIAELETAQMDAKNQMLRALADADNTRKRAERDRDDTAKYATSNFARSLLSVADNFRRALDAIPTDLRDAEPRLAGLISGIEATERELLASFDRAGIKKIDARDQMFNANLHEVMFEVPGTGKPAGTIMQIIEDGYTIHDRLLRPARVGVAKAEAGSAPPSHAIDTKA